MSPDEGEDFLMAYVPLLSSCNCGIYQVVPESARYYAGIKWSRRNINGLDDESRRSADD